MPFFSKKKKSSRSKKKGEAGDMGNCVRSQEKKDGGKAKVPTDTFKYHVEQGIIDKTIMASKKVDKAAMVGFEDGALRAWSPSDFIPDQQCIDDIIDAFKGDISGLAERGLNVGNGVYPSVPGKMDEGKAIYGNDGHRGGTSAFKSKECVLIVVFHENPTLANRLGLETVDFMEENGK